MKWLPVQSIMVLLSGIGQVPGATQLPAMPVSDASADSGPRIEFAAPIYDFGKVMAGQVVRHDFIFTNTGTETLEINAVSPSCGCTTAGTWTHRVEPGQTGVIPLQFDSERFPGQTVTKTATVSSNDKRQPSLLLQLRGTVWTPIELSPQSAIFSYISDAQSNSSVMVRIVSHLDEAITLSEPQCANQAFTATLKTIDPGKDFQLLIQAKPPFPQGATSTIISMKTYSTNVPSINVTAMAIVQPAVLVRPDQVTLSRAGLGTNALPPSIIVIRSSSAKLLSLSDPAFSVPGVGVEMKETIPGREFTLTLNYPPGFSLAENSEAYLTVKTSHPQYPLIKIPVREIRPPTPAVGGSAPLPAGAR